PLLPQGDHKAQLAWPAPQVLMAEIEGPSEAWQEAGELFLFSAKRGYRLKPRFLPQEGMRRSLVAVLPENFVTENETNWRLVMLGEAGPQVLQELAPPIGKHAFIHGLKEKPLHQAHSLRTALARA